MKFWIRKLALATRVPDDIFRIFSTFGSPNVKLDKSTFIPIEKPVTPWKLLRRCTKPSDKVLDAFEAVVQHSSFMRATQPHSFLSEQSTNILWRDYQQVPRTHWKEAIYVNKCWRYFQTWQSLISLWLFTDEQLISKLFKEEKKNPAPVNWSAIWSGLCWEQARLYSRNQTRSDWEWSNTNWSWLCDIF